MPLCVHLIFDTIDANNHGGTHMHRIFGTGFETYSKAEQLRIALGREVAQEGMVLLENNGVLPL